MNKVRPKFKWEAAIPERIKEKRGKSPGAFRDLSEDSVASTPLVHNAQVSVQKTLESPSGPLYSIKYLGITKGQIGILSKRSPIPHLSPLETCKDVPLSLINSSISDKKTSGRLINKLINVPNTDLLVSDFFIEKIEDVAEEQNFPDPEAYNEFVVHTYARPKALISVRKQFGEDGVRRPIVVPYNRVGISGWKLSRPKTAMRTVTVDRKNRTRCATRREKKFKEQVEIPEFFNEPYLKYLAEKRSNESRREG